MAERTDQRIFYLGGPVVWGETAGQDAALYRHVYLCLSVFYCCDDSGAADPERAYPQADERSSGADGGYQQVYGDHLCRLACYLCLQCFFSGAESSGRQPVPAVFSDCLRCAECSSGYRVYCDLPYGSGGLRLCYSDRPGSIGGAVPDLHN